MIIINKLHLEDWYVQIEYEDLKEIFNYSIMPVNYNLKRCINDFREWMFERGINMEISIQEMQDFLKEKQIIT